MLSETPLARSVLSYKYCPVWRMAACIWNVALQGPFWHICDASQGTAEVLNCSAVCCMQVIDGVINKLWDKDYDGAKIYQDYEKGLQELLSIITASSPGEHFQLPQQDSSQLAQVSFSFAFPSGASPLILQLLLQLLHQLLLLVSGFGRAMVAHTPPSCTPTLHK